jgi:L-iditol 2-dehydrogenase
MIAARYTQCGELKIAETPMPRAGAGDLLLKVEAASICGTDVKIARHGHRKLADGQTITLGHEFVGRIVEVGTNVKGWRSGQRVGVAPNVGCGRCEMCGRGMANMCPEFLAFGINFDGAHAEYVRVPAAALEQGNVMEIAEAMPAEEATLAEPLSCAVNGLRVSRLELGDIVVVFGAGPMGLLNMMCARISGASAVGVVDVNAFRLEKAKELGADWTIDSSKQSVTEAVNAKTNGHGADVIILAAAVGALQQLAVSLLAPFGRLCLFAGLPRGDSQITLDTNEIHYKNLVVTGMTGGSPSDYRIALRLMETGRINARAVVSDVFAMNDLKKAYEAAMSGNSMKVVIKG